MPLFFLLSGLSLGLRDGPVELPGFWLRRLRKTGLPYVLWTLFYFLLDRGFRLGWITDPAALGELGRDLFLGGAASHLWFIPALLQLYLLYPLLRYLMKRWPRTTLGAGLALTLFSTLIIYVPLPLTGWWRPHLWRMFPVWVFYFLLGMALTKPRLERLADFCGRFAPQLLVLGLAAACVYAWDAARSGNLDSIRPQLLLYTPVCLAFLLAVWTYLKQLPGMEKASDLLAETSMTVYFIHLFFLRLLRRVPLLTANAIGMLGLFAATLVLSLGAALVLSRLFRLIRRPGGTSPGGAGGAGGRRS